MSETQVKPKLNLGLGSALPPGVVPFRREDPDHFWATPNQTQSASRSSSSEVRIRVPFLSVVYFSRGTLPKKRVKGHYWGT